MQPICNLLSRRSFFFSKTNLYSAFIFTIVVAIFHIAFSFPSISSALNLMKIFVFFMLFSFHRIIPIHTSKHTHFLNIVLLCLFFALSILFPTNKLFNFIVQLNEFFSGYKSTWKDVDVRIKKK